MNVELRNYVKRLMRLGYSRSAAVIEIRWRAYRDNPNGKTFEGDSLDSPEFAPLFTTPQVKS